MCCSALCPEAAEPQLTKSCDLCGREFRSIAGFKRHKCLAEHLKPLHEQHGAVQCSHCDRWFASHGGLSVHCCIAATASSQPTPLPEAEPTRQALTNQPCCCFHCSTCNRCFKSAPGFSRHNYFRFKRQTPLDRSTFPFSCSHCSRRFRRKQDLSRHKCH